MLLSGLLAIPIQFAVMYFVYSRWILPAINQIVSDVPIQVRGFVEPFVNEKLDEISKTVKMSNVRFQRTIKDAADALDLSSIDLTTDEGIEDAKSQLLAKNYPMNVVVEAVTRVINSIEANKSASKSKEGVTTW